MSQGATSRLVSAATSTGAHSSWAAHFLRMIKRLTTHRSGTGQKTLAFFSDYLRLPARHKSERAPYTCLASADQRHDRHPDKRPARSLLLEDALFASPPRTEEPASSRPFRPRKR